MIYRLRGWTVSRDYCGLWRQLWSDLGRVWDSLKSVQRNPGNSIFCLHLWPQCQVINCQVLFFPSQCTVNHVDALLLVGAWLVLYALHGISIFFSTQHTVHQHTVPVQTWTYRPHCCLIIVAYWFPLRHGFLLYCLGKCPMSCRPVYIPMLVTSVYWWHSSSRYLTILV